MAHENGGTGTVDATDIRDTKQDGPAEGADKPDGDMSQKVIFGNREFASVEEAAKSYTELEKKLGSQGNEVGTLRKELEAARQQAQLADKLDRIAQNTAKPEGPTPFDQYKETLKAKYGEQEAQPYVEILETTGGWLAAEAKRNDELREELRKREQRESELDQRFTKLEAEQLKATPDYATNQEIVDRFVEKGMSLRDAILEAKEIRKHMGAAQPERVDPPSSVSASRNGAGGGKAKVSLFTEEEKVRMGKEDPGFWTPERIAEMEADFKQRLAAARGAQ